MAKTRIILELGAGTALHGGEYTKAAVRAVDDCIHHSSMSFTRALGIKPQSLAIEVTVGVQKPEKVDAAAVKAKLPYGEVTVKVVKGGLDVVDEETGDVTVIASAAVAVRADIPKRTS